MTYPLPRSFLRRVASTCLALGFLLALAAPMPAQEPAAESQLTVFHLQHISASSAGEVVNQVFVGEDMRIATDERTNSLIVSSGVDRLRKVEALLQSLDRDDANAGKPGLQPVQVRVFWLMTGPGGSDPPEMLYPVMEELNELGIRDLRLAGRMSINVGREGRPFTVSSRPVVNDANFVFTFDGVITSQPGGAPEMEARIKCVQPGQEGPLAFASLDTNIETPLNQFIVLGTTVAAGADSVFVLQLVPREAAKEKQ